MKKTYLFLLTLSASVLAGCGTNSTSSVDNGTLSSDYSTSVKDYLKALKGIKNYSLLETVSSSKVSQTNQIEVFYDSTYFYYSFGTSSYGYVSSKDGIYPVNYSEDGLIGGELYRDDDGATYTDLWSNGFFTSFADLVDEQIDKMEGGSSSVAIKGKQNKLALLSLFGLNSSYYGTLQSMSASINDSNELEFSVKVYDSDSEATVSINAVVYDLLSSSSSEISNFLLDGGTYFVIDDGFDQVRTLMKGNNYTHYYYDSNKIVGTEYFNQNYYFMYWDSTYAGEMASSGQILYSQGLIGIDHKKDSSGNKLNGAYLVTISNNQFSVMLSYAYAEDSSIPTVYHYPSLMSCWNNPEFFEAANIPDDMEDCLSTTDSVILNSFVENFSLTDSVSGVKLQSLVISWANLDIKDEAKIRFELSTSGGSLTYEFCKFGETSIPAFDSFLGSLTDQ